MPSKYSSAENGNHSKPFPEEENPWKLALEGSGLGIWDWNLVTGEQTHSARWEEMLGFSAGELKQGYQEFADRVHPDDLVLQKLALKDYMASKVSAYAADIRMRCKDGSWRWIVSRGIVV